MMIRAILGFSIGIAVALHPTFSVAEEIKIGLLLDLKGPTRTISRKMESAAKFAVTEASRSGIFLNGTTISTSSANSTCVDAAKAVAAAAHLISTQGAVAIVGPSCSTAAEAVIQNVVAPGRVVMISPSATSVHLSKVRDSGFFFRTAPSDARQASLMARALADRGLKRVAFTYPNSAYGQTVANEFRRAFARFGGKISVSLPHTSSSGDQRNITNQLINSGSRVLVVAGGSDFNTDDLVKLAVKSGAFENFALFDEMYDRNVARLLGGAANGSFGLERGSGGNATKAFSSVARSGRLDPNSDYVQEAYDAAALVILAMQSAGSSKSRQLAKHVIQVANAPGEKIYAGELAKGLAILARGGNIDYVGASSVELDKRGESLSSYREYELRGGKVVVVRIR